MSVVLLRHASAGDRAAWTDDDRRRPLDKKGWKQASRLVDELRELGVTRVLSSPYDRCIQTVEPLAEELGVGIEIDDRLAEGAGRAAALELLGGLEDAVACTHGDIVEEVLGRSLKKGEYSLIY
ncbi:MAG TPA: phosphoglycerate mutase family protein [Gaiellaceae bacterium]|nr:phosphoglycerate mutase family protein [Gaiellaceae bacterium]